VSAKRGAIAIEGVESTDEPAVGVGRQMGVACAGHVDPEFSTAKL
jgi:hypothetical protein